MLVQSILSDDIEVIPQGAGTVILRIRPVANPDWQTASQVSATVKAAIEAALVKTRQIVQQAIANLPTPAPGSNFPHGVIVMWSGPLDDIPNGFVLCDGNNGTPNLLDRFILSVGTGEDPGATGGSNTHTHTSSGASGSTAATGVGVLDNASNVPVFAKLAFLMKL